MSSTLIRTLVQGSCCVCRRACLLGSLHNFSSSAESFHMAGGCGPHLMWWVFGVVSRGRASIPLCHRRPLPKCLAVWFPIRIQTRLYRWLACIPTRLCSPCFQYTALAVLVELAGNPNCALNCLKHCVSCTKPKNRTRVVA